MNLKVPLRVWILYKSHPKESTPIKEPRIPSLLRTVHPLHLQTPPLKHRPLPLPNQPRTGPLWPRLMTDSTHFYTSVKYTSMPYSAGASLEHNRGSDSGAFAKTIWRVRCERCLKPPACAVLHERWSAGRFSFAFTKVIQAAAFLNPAKHTTRCFHWLLFWKSVRKSCKFGC